MSDNVLILGAGFSYDAGIPLLSGFVERMWEYATRKKANGVELTSDQAGVLEEALKVRAELDSYHGRATFDDRNIEDILSMLAFNVLGGGKSEKAKLDAMTQAIACTIELSCRVKHPGLPKGRARYTAISDEPRIYRDFWRLLFSFAHGGNQLPTIITFNYDLVLERSLFQLLINTEYDGYEKKLPFSRFRVSYQNDAVPEQQFAVEYASYGHTASKAGTILRQNIADTSTAVFDIDLLKLHGSLNFPKRALENASDYNITQVVNDPHILPPISNKLAGNTAEDIWRTALNRLRQAKNVIFVGYSLPRTDIYMQYFLKAALGPNTGLNRLFIFDPLLCTNDPRAEEMRRRYEQCFAEQLRSRMCFRPDQDILQIRNPRIIPGSLLHFIAALEEKPAALLF